MSSIEYRSTAGPDDIDASDSGTIFGLAIPFNRKTTIGDIRNGGFREDIAAGACKKSMAEGDIVALFNHDSSKPLGRTSAGNLRLKATARGVEPELNPVDVTYARDLKALVKAKIIRGWSFGFEVLKDTWTDDDGKESDQWSGTNRTINEMRLIEVSPVTFPAYPQTDISSRDSITAAREGRGTKVKRSAATAKPFIDDAAAMLVRAYNELNEDDRAQLPSELRRVFERDDAKPYGNVDYADPGYQEDGKKRYPLDTKAHAKAAWSYINQATNRTAYTSAQLSTMESKIKAACKKFGVVVDEENSLFLAMEWRKHTERYTEFGEKREINILAQSGNNCPDCGTELACPSCAGNPNAHEEPDADDSERAEEDAPETREDEPTEDETPEPTDTVESAEEVREDETSESESRDNAEPDDSTPHELPPNDALRWLMAQQIRREVELGN